MKNKYFNGFMDNELRGRKKEYGLNAGAESFLKPAIKKKEEENYSPELETFFKTGDRSALESSVAQTILKDRIAKDKKDNEGINNLSVWGRYNTQKDKEVGKPEDNGQNKWQGKTQWEEPFYKSKPVEGKSKDWSSTPEYKENMPWDGNQWVAKNKNKKEGNLFENIYNERNKIKDYDFETENIAPRTKAFEEPYWPKESKEKKNGNGFSTADFYKKDPVPKDIKLSQWEWDELEDFEKEWTVEGTKKQMEKDRKERQIKEYMPTLKENGGMIKLGENKKEDEGGIERLKSERTKY